MYRNVFLGAILLSMPLVVWSQQDTIADQRLEEIMVTKGCYPVTTCSFTLFFF